MILVLSQHWFHRAYSPRIPRILLLGVGWGGGVSSDPTRLRTIFPNPRRLSKTWVGSAAGENFEDLELKYEQKTAHLPWTSHEKTGRMHNRLSESLFCLPRSFEFMDSIFCLSVNFRIQKHLTISWFWYPEKIPIISIILEPASRGMVGDEADQNELSFARNSKIELQICVRSRAWPGHFRWPQGSSSLDLPWDRSGKSENSPKSVEWNRAKRSGQAFSENVCSHQTECGFAAIMAKTSARKFYGTFATVFSWELKDWSLELRNVIERSGENESSCKPKPIYST